ncbi:MAG: MazG-like family protein [Brevundimonas sp.]
MTQTFSTLRAANRARQAEWDPSTQITLAFRGNELGGECGEAQNVIKKLERERLGIRGSRATVEDLAEELADVVICADLIAMDADIDLDSAVEAKFNATSHKNHLKTHLVRDSQSNVAGWRTDVENAPRDGSLFLGCNADHPTFGAHAMQRHVRLAFGPDGQPTTEDLGAWLILHGNQHDYDDGTTTQTSPQYAIAPDDLNTSVRYAWQPLPSTGHGLDPSDPVAETV